MGEREWGREKRKTRKKRKKEKKGKMQEIGRETRRGSGYMDCCDLNVSWVHVWKLMKSAYGPVAGRVCVDGTTEDHDV